MPQLKWCRRLAASVVAATLVLSAPASTYAQSSADTATARALAIEAQKAYEAKRYAEAAEKFGKAEQLHHAPTLMVGQARSLAKLGKILEAQELYNKVIREELPPNASKAFKRAQSDAKEELKQLDGRIAWAKITIKDAKNPEVSLDGMPINPVSLGIRRAMNPGEHVLKVRAAGFDPKIEKFELDEGQDTIIEVELYAEGKTPGGAPKVDPIGPVAPAPTPTPTPVPEQPEDEGPGMGTQEIMAFASFGAAGAGLILGGVMAGLSASKHSELNELCTDGACPKAAEDPLNDFALFSGMTIGGFVAAGAFAGAGVALLLTAPADEEAPAADDAPKKEDAPAAQLRIGPTWIGVQGTF